MYAAQEAESLQKSSQMVSDLTSLSQSILGDLGEQRTRMKVSYQFEPPNRPLEHALTLYGDRSLGSANKTARYCKPSRPFEFAAACD